MRLLQSCSRLDCLRGNIRKVETFLRSQGKSNFELIKTFGRTIDVESETIDFIYSFIVLQHLPSFSVHESYVKETY